ncbi:DUF2653 family protein [Aneurinibacillus terranovensis]|uniref:DUF2653 family protein n=1 Tax=Aneurinibacillus terranovensis TaxID=278991 RepID=UPI00041E51C7|nr:DUF2653 family protein [Aneurinibacillus terranovensis]
MKIHFIEQDVVDACCVFVAKRHFGIPEEVDVDLQFNPGSGFAADARKGYQNIRLTEQDLIDAIAVYLADYHNFIPENLRVSLSFNQQTGIEADIMVV